MTYRTHDSATGHQFMSLCPQLLTGNRICLTVTADKDIAVAGAGLAGLAFGLSLMKLCREQGVKALPRIHIFDRDASPEARAGQGYFLSVRSDSGGMQASMLPYICRCLKA